LRNSIPETKDLKLSDLALAINYRAGFSSRSAFYKAFKKLTGASPVEFVRSLQQ